MGMIEEKKAMTNMIDTWHRRLDHASMVKLSKVDFLKNHPVSFNNETCDSCDKAKLVRTPSPISTIKSKDVFELIRCGIWGGYRVPSYTKAN